MTGRRWLAAAAALMMVVNMARVVELYIDGAWVDVTAAPRYVLADDPITITRGGDAQSLEDNPGSCSLSLLDRDKDGRWSNRVPGSTYFGKLGRNIPVRISDGSDVRAVMEIPEWDPRWERTGAKVRAELTAAGILRRLTEGAASLRSPGDRAILAGAPAAWWPLTDASGARGAASGLVGGQPMTLTGSMQFAAVDGPLGVGRRPELLDGGTNYTGELRGRVTLPSPTTWTVDVWVRGVTDQTNDQMNPLGFDISGTSKFTRGELNVVHDNGAGTTQINVYFYDTVGNVATFLADSGYQVIDGGWHHIAIKMAQASVSTMDMELWADGVLVNSAAGVSGTIGTPAEVYAPGRVVSGSVNNFVNLSVADIAVYGDDSEPADRYEAGTGYLGEAAGRRIERLCGEESVAFTGIGDLDATEPMGPQTADTLVALLRQAARTDQGALFETRTELGLTYRTRVSMYNQYGPAIGYGDQVITGDLEPTEDVALAHNDVTAQLPAGGPGARSVLDGVVEPADGYHRLTTQAPPDGIGTYDRGTVVANVATTDRLAAVAGWVRHLGTWDELRYPNVVVHFDGAGLVADAALAAELAALDRGDRLRLTGLPAWLPPDEVAAIVRGTVEELGTHTRTLAYNLAPGWPWEVIQIESGGSTIAAPVAASATSIKLATSSGPAWSETDEPYYLQAGGNAFKVTAVTTDTAAFIASGTATHASNASVTPGMPAGITPDVGQLLTCRAAIRNSGTGTVDLPAGWTDIVNFGNVRMFGRYYRTGDAAPLVTFTGGAANATTSAQLDAWSGTSLHTEFTATQLNGSAQDIAFPAGPVSRYSNRRNGRLLLWYGWKQDDWTGAAVIGGGFASEAADVSSTTGDDQGMMLDYFVQTTAGQPGATSSVITGGAAAISRGIVVALRPLQTATVVRNVNGANTSIAAGESVYGWRSGVIGL